MIENPSAEAISRAKDQPKTVINHHILMALFASMSNDEFDGKNPVEKQSEILKLIDKIIKSEFEDMKQESTGYFANPENFPFHKMHEAKHAKEVYNRGVEVAQMLQKHGLASEKNLYSVAFATAWHDIIQESGPGKNEIETVSTIQKIFQEMAALAGQKWETFAIGGYKITELMPIIEALVLDTTPSFKLNTINHNGESFSGAEVNVFGTHIQSLPNLESKEKLACEVVMLLADLGAGPMEDGKNAGFTINMIGQGIIQSFTMKLEMLTKSSKPEDKILLKLWKTPTEDLSKTELEQSTTSFIKYIGSEIVYQTNLQKQIQEKITQLEAVNQDVATELKSRLFLQGPENFYTFYSDLNSKQSVDIQNIIHSLQ